MPGPKKHLQPNPQARPRKATITAARSRGNIVGNGGSTLAKDQSGTDGLAFPESGDPTEKVRCKQELTNREKQVLALIAEGFMQKGVAHALGITINTANTHLKKILKKLGAKNRTTAVVWFVLNGHFSKTVTRLDSGDIVVAPRSVSGVSICPTCGSPPAAGARRLPLAAAA